MMRLQSLLRLVAMLCLVTGFGQIQPLATHAQTATSTVTAEDPAGSAESELAEELPPPDLPSSNEEGYIFELDASTTIDLNAIPREAVVYALVWKDPSANRAARIAENLGVEGEVNDRGNGTYDVSDGTNEIYVSSALVQYFSVAPTSDGDLPDDAAAISYAREWLRTAGLLPQDADAGEVTIRSEETNRVTVLFLPLEPENMLAAYPSALITVGTEGVVVEASIRWPQIERADLYQLREAKDAWQEVASGQAFVQVDLPEGIAEADGTVRGSVTYSELEIAYTTAGLPGGTQYLEPVYVFSGRLKPEGTDEQIRIKAYVSAVANTGAPVG